MVFFPLFFETFRSRQVGLALFETSNAPI
jgi:hypothetical protein